MKTKDIFLGLNYIGEDLVAEAENGAFTASRKEAKRASLFRKPFFLAALIALMVFLMGCAVVYILKMEDMRVGQQERYYDQYDYNTMEYLGKHYYTEQVFSAAGQEGSPAYEAAQEWFAFKQSYDPDRAIQKEVWGKEPDFPAEYDSYHLYTQEMKDKLDEIVRKYDLKLAGKELEFHNIFKLCDALGVEQSVVDHPDVLLTVRDGQCWESGNFSMSLTFSFRESLDTEMLSTWGNLSWNRKDCFTDDVIAFEDTGDWKQWYYRSSSGNEMLILRSPSDTRGWILCDRGDAILSVELETTRELWNNVDGQTWADELVLTDEQVEQIADAIDFGIQPRIPTQENQPAPSNEATQDGYTVKLKSVETDGWVVKIVMGITAPEGTVISRNPHTGFEDEAYYINPANYDSFECQSGNVAATSGGWNLIDDGDSLENTQDIVMVNSVLMDDGIAPFGPGMVWNIYFADIMGNYYDSQHNMLTDFLAEGTWLFPITFDETIGDYTEKELIRDPIAVGVSVGWKPDGSDAVEDVTVTSFKLRKYSATIEHSGNAGADFSFLNGQPLLVVMKDGTEIQLCLNNTSVYETDTAIDLEQVDHIAFADGTILTVPET